MRQDDDTRPLYRRPFPELIGLAQRLRDGRLRGEVERPALVRKVALLGGYSTQFLARFLDLFLFERGIDAELLESDYGSMDENLLNPDSPLYAFGPDVTLLLPDPGALALPPIFSEPTRVKQAAQAEAARWSGYWHGLLARTNSQVLHANFELPGSRSLGNHEGSAAFGATAFVRAVNAELLAAAPPGVTIFDLEYLTGAFGTRRAVDARGHYLSKQHFSFEFLPILAHALSRTIAAQAGLSRKCAVLDLDGTLWGGVVGEDGIDNLVLGPDSPEGEAFLDFQRYLKALRERGVLLAVCSKNEDDIAREVFERHPYMLLKLDDIACFVANWQDKASNVRHIASTLNIGLDSLVFVDNSAEERHMVRTGCPDVAVLELPDDPAEYVQALDEALYFEVSELSAEAGLRTASLIQNQQRAEAQGGFADYDDYLASLSLRAAVLPIGDDNIARVCELIKRTNQFNLRTVRHGEGRVRELVALPGSVAFCIRVGDRFGSYGIVNVVIAEPRGEALFIDTWLMSCRVLKKGVEQLAMARLLERARALGVSAIEAEYRPTPKNRMVRQFYPQLGFRQVSERGAADERAEDAPVRYRLELADELPTLRHFIAVDRDGDRDGAEEGEDPDG